MSDLLSIGASGIRAYQSALTTTSENIANAGTTGYVRRSAALQEVNASGSSLLGGKTIAGLGARVAGVDRASDMFRSAELRVATSEAGRSTSEVSWLERIEQSLTSYALDGRLTNFFNAAQAVAADPAALAPRSVMLEDAANLAAAFRGTAEQLSAAAGDLDDIAQRTAGEINNIASALANVNGSLARAAPGSSGQAYLLDERDRMLQQLSGLVDVQASFDAAGRATVKIGGGGGALLVEPSGAGAVTYAPSSTGSVSFSVAYKGGETAIAANGGAVGGLVESARRIAEARLTIDTLATDFAAGIEAVQAGGQTLDGVAGVAMFAGTGAADLALVVTDPRGIAAAAAGGGTRDNANIAAFAELRATGGFEARTTQLIAGNGAALSGRRMLAGAQGAIADGARQAFEAASGVNLDEEAVNLMRFQQAYQASSRVIQVARETLQSILDIR